MSKDRAETANLAEQMPDKVRELSQLWEQHLDEFRTLALKDLPPPKPRAGKKAGKK